MGEHIKLYTNSKETRIKYRLNEYYNTTYERYVEIKNKLGNKDIN
jgi:hypothetical protein